MGCGAGSLSIVRSYFADVSTKEQRTTVMAIVALVQVRFSARLFCFVSYSLVFVVNKHKTNPNIEATGKAKP